MRPAIFRQARGASHGLLIFGPDAMRVALKRQQVIAALLGPGAEEEMRLPGWPAGDLRKDAARLMDAVKAQGFFPGPRAAFVEDANDSAADAILAALSDWQEGDAQIIVTAGQLKATSKIRKAFEAIPMPMPLEFMTNRPRARRSSACWRGRSARHSRPGDGLISRRWPAISTPVISARRSRSWRFTSWDDDGPLSSEDIAACAPASTEADLDDILNIVAEGRSGEIGPGAAAVEGAGGAAGGAVHRGDPAFPGALHGGLGSRRGRRRASPGCARRSLARAATGCCDRRRAGGRRSCNRADDPHRHRSATALGGTAGPRDGADGTGAYPVGDAGG